MTEQIPDDSPQDAPSIDETDTAGDDDTPDLDPAIEAGALRALLAGLLPYAQMYAHIDPADGGPEPDDLVADPDDPDSATLPEVLQTREVLRGNPEAALEAGPVDDLDAPDPALEQDAPAPSGDPLLDAARAFVLAVEAQRAHRIAGLDAGDGAQRARDTLIRTAEADPAPRELD